jgi:hypothetical protein
MLNDLIVERDAPPKRRGKCVDNKEQHFTEAAVMLAYAEHLFRTLPELTRVEIHPDGEHAKRFNISHWLSARGFAVVEKHGQTSYWGTYARGQQVIFVQPKSGLGDVVAKLGQTTLVAECKGGIINSSHAGAVSRLRKGLCEVIGQLMQMSQGGRQIAVVPHTEGTSRLAAKTRTASARC